MHSFFGAASRKGSNTNSNSNSQLSTETRDWMLKTLERGLFEPLLRMCGKRRVKTGGTCYTVRARMSHCLSTRNE